jgi:hypothetical protein
VCRLPAEDLADFFVRVLADNARDARPVGTNVTLALNAENRTICVEEQVILSLLTQELLLDMFKFFVDIMKDLFDKYNVVVMGEVPSIEVGEPVAGVLIGNLTSSSSSSSFLPLPPPQPQSMWVIHAPPPRIEITEILNSPGCVKDEQNMEGICLFFLMEVFSVIII